MGYGFVPNLLHNLVIYFKLVNIVYFINRINCSSNSYLIQMYLQIRFIKMRIIVLFYKLINLTQSAWDHSVPRIGER